MESASEKSVDLESAIRDRECNWQQKMQLETESPIKDSMQLETKSALEDGLQIKKMLCHKLVSHNYSETV